MPPKQAFDDVYWMATESVSAWLLTSSDGYILYDAANVQLADRQTGERHPLNVGADAVARYFKIEDECAQAQRLKIMAEPDRGG